jgi:hypothetical protein
MSKRSAKAARMVEWLEDNHDRPGCCEDLADSLPRRVIVARLNCGPFGYDSIILDIYSDEDLENWYNDTVQLLAGGDFTDFDVAANHADPYADHPPPLLAKDDRLPPGTLNLPDNALGDS